MFYCVLSHIYHIFIHIVLDWIAVSENTCIKGYSDEAVQNVNSINQCKVACEAKPSCLSIDYYGDGAVCLFNNADSSTVSTEFCDGFSFTEYVRGNSRFLNYP